jgi:hypothetical protein
VASIQQRAPEIVAAVTVDGLVNYAEALARLFEDSTIDDSGVQNPGTETPLARRLVNILTASADAANDGITHWSGIFHDWHQFGKDGVFTGDTGFKFCFQDHMMWPGSSMQVCHFITAADMGYRPHKTYLYVKHYTDMLPGDPWEHLAMAIADSRRDLSQPSRPGWWSPDELECVNLMIGHEKVPDSGSSSAQTEIIGKVLAMFRASPADYAVFRLAFDGMGPGPLHDPARAQGTLSAITIGPPEDNPPGGCVINPIGVGNSMADLSLSLFGFKCGAMIRKSDMTSIADGGNWVRINLKDPASKP